MSFLTKENVAIVGVAMAAVGGYFLAKTLIKVTKVSNSLEVALEDLEKSTSVEIKEAIVDKAVERKATEVADKAVKKAVEEIKYDIADSARKEVKKAVDINYESIEAQVKEKIQSELKDLNIERTRQEVIKEAKEAAAKKFETDMENVLEKYNANLDKLTNIYGSIAQKMNPINSSSFSF